MEAIMHIFCHVGAAADNSFRHNVQWETEYGSLLFVIITHFTHI